jgi:hypothetical protein
MFIPNNNPDRKRISFSWSSGLFDSVNNMSSLSFSVYRVYSRLSIWINNKMFFILKEK